MGDTSDVDGLRDFLARTAPSSVAPYPISAPGLSVTAPVVASPLVDADVLWLWSNAFASKGVLLFSPNYRLKTLGAINLVIANWSGTITKADMMSSTFITQIKTETDKRVSDLLLLLTGPRLKLILQKTVDEAAAGKLTLSIEKLTYILLDAEWMLLGTSTEKARALTVWDNLYPVHLPTIAPVPTSAPEVDAYITAVAAGFNAAAPPTVTGISPGTGSPSGGTSVTITGTGFTGATGVTIGGTAATSVTVVSGTSITCTTPAGTAGPASVVVTTPNGANAANTLFTYVASNVAPVVLPDSLSRPNTTRLAKVPLGVLLANATDTDLDPLSITDVGNATQTSPGTATVAIVGTFVVYTASAVDAGNGSFEYTVSDGAGHAVSATVTVTESSTPGGGDGTPNALGIAPAGGDFVVTFIGIPGLTYRVQYTTDVSPPQNWVEFVLTPPATAVHTAAANGVFSHTDLAPGGPQRFYRAVLQPAVNPDL